MYFGTRVCFARPLLLTFQNCWPGGDKREEALRDGDSYELKELREDKPPVEEAEEEMPSWRFRSPTLRALCSRFFDFF